MVAPVLDWFVVLILLLLRVWPVGLGVVGWLV